MLEVLAVLIPACAIAVFLCPRRGRARARHVVGAITLASCLGIGFSSLTTLALVASGIALTTRRFVLFDMAIWTTVAAIGWWLRAQRRHVREAPAVTSGDEPRSPWILRVVFAVTAIAALASVVRSYIAAPHGEWDAWAIWNLHARFLFRGGGSRAWQTLFAIDWSQPDYPLLLPASVARVWAYAGRESTLAPALIATIFGAASVALVMTALTGRWRWIAGTLMLGATTFLTQVAAQCADVPVACFIVATLVMMCRGERLLSLRTVAPIVGATSAMAAWTKNEGLVFALLILMVGIANAIRPADDGRGYGERWRPLSWAMAGAAPVLLIIAWFKLTLAPSSGLVAGQSLSTVAARFLDPHRHAAVALLMGQHAMAWSATLAVAIFPLGCLCAIGVATSGGRLVRTMAVVLGLMLASYYVVYVTTPFDITWHVTTSVDRLLVQLWPALVLTVFLGLESRTANSQAANSQGPTPSS